MWCSAADTYLKLLDRAVSGARFLTMCVFECDIAHRRSVAVLRVLYKIRCNPLHPLYCVRPVRHVPVLVTRGALATHWYTTYAPPRCRTSQCRRTFIPISGSCGTILPTLYSMVWDRLVLRAGMMLFHVPMLLVPFWSSTVFPFLSFLSVDWYCGTGVFRLIWCRSLYPSLALPTSFNNNNNSNNNNNNSNSNR